MNYAEFQEAFDASRDDLLRETFIRCKREVRVKKERTAMRNLERIFAAALKIGNEKGFQAMSIRDLSAETCLSAGALYAYFPGKDELLGMIQSHGRSVVRRILNESVTACSEPVAKLRTAIRTHLHLSEALQPWFYFSYMEAKNLSGPEKQKAIESELYTERIVADILRMGMRSGAFIDRDAHLTAGVVKAMLQDWYLKRPKYAKRGITVDEYADFVIAFTEAFCVPVGPAARNKGEALYDRA